MTRQAPQDADCNVEPEMSSLQKSLPPRDAPAQHPEPSNGLSGAFRRPPPKPLMHTAFREEDEHLLDYSSGSSSSASSAASIDTIVPSHPIQRRRRPPAAAPWTDYFAEEMYLDTADLEGTEGSSGRVNAKHHVYLTRPVDVKKDVLFICHHGAGSSGLSFAILARELRRRLPGCGVLSVEAREHGSVIYGAKDEPNGDTSMSDQDHDSHLRTSQSPVDLSIASLTADLLRSATLVAHKLRWSISQWPPTILIGHSLGGAVITRLASDISAAKRLNLVGFCVIDVVEGSAMDALKSMQSYLATRPTSFSSVEEAIDWHVRSRTIRNAESARVSTPPLLIPQETADGETSWTWRTDLGATSPHWEDWFRGLSAAFLGGKAAKLLVLAGTDRLDKELMIGQMQGRFQLVVVPEAGHFVQEDAPEKLADTLVEFWRRNDRSAMVLPPKVSDLLKAGKKV